MKCVTPPYPGSRPPREFMLDRLNAATVIHTIIWDPTEPTATRPLLLSTPESWFTYGFDQVKNATELFDASGNIAASYDYAPFGALVAATGNTASPITFSSEIYDAALGMQYFNWRHLNTLEGRWINCDPMEDKGGLNLYGFIQNNIQLIDPLGLKVFFTEYPPDYNGDPTSSDWTTIPPDNKPASAFHRKKISPPKYEKTTHSFLGLVRGQCELSNLKVEGESRIFVSRSISDPASIEKAVAHELIHRRDMKTLLTDFNTAAEPYMIAACCTCTDAIEKYLPVLWTLHLNIYQGRSASLDCRDYPPGPEKNHRCQEEKRYDAIIGQAMRMASQAKQSMEKACGK